MFYWRCQRHIQERNSHRIFSAAIHLKNDMAIKKNIYMIVVANIRISWIPWILISKIPCNHTNPWNYLWYFFLSEFKWTGDKHYILSITTHEPVKPHSSEESHLTVIKNNLYQGVRLKHTYSHRGCSNKQINVLKESQCFTHKEVKLLMDHW